ncbi:MAG: radical SAM protein [Vulcanimicrobiaceae bacterium]
MSRRWVGLAYTDRRGRIFYDEESEPLADGGLVRPVLLDELVRAPGGTVPVMLPGRSPLLRHGSALRRTALGALLPAGYTRLLLPAYEERKDAPPLPLFGYAFACVVDDDLYVAAARTDEDPNWKPRTFAEGELEKIVAARLATDSGNPVLAQLARCSLEYGCFTAQNVFLEQGEAALAVSPKCNARCVGCISELDDDAGIPSPQARIAYEIDADAPARIAIHHLERVPHGIVSFGQGCEGEPLLRATTIARTIAKIRERTGTGTVNLNSNGSLPKSLQALIDAGLDAVRVSLNSFRPPVYAAYYRPIGYELDDVLESVRIATRAGLRVSLNLLTHPGVTDDAPEVAAMTEFLRETPVALVQTRTLNIDPHRYFALTGRPKEPLGMRAALAAIRTAGIAVGNFTHTH